MAKTAQLDLPLIAPAQAQKHVTVNEALARLDAVAQLRVLSSSLARAAAERRRRGELPGARRGDGRLAGPVRQARGVEQRRLALRGAEGRLARLGREPAGASAVRRHRLDPRCAGGVAGGAAALWKVIELDHEVTAGPSNLTAAAIPAQSQVFGVTGRVMAAISGPGLAGWRIGVSGSDNRYGSGLGLAQGSYLVGLSGSPVTYYADTSLLADRRGRAACGRQRSPGDPPGAADAAARRLCRRCPTAALAANKARRARILP